MTAKRQTSNFLAPVGEWRTSVGFIGQEKPFGLLGILNLTPDSFYDGGQHNSLDMALHHAGKLVEDGADILDLGAESTRPGSVEISEEEEISRLLPALRAISSRFPDVLISVDTWRGQVAAMALENGAAIINDTSACGRDPLLAEVLTQYKPGYVLMHSRGLPARMQEHPAYNDVVKEVKSFFAGQLAKLAKLGLPEENIALDPGIGFGKQLRHNLELLANLGKFMEFRCPILVGVSMKSMFGQLLGQDLPDRGASTAVTSALAWQNGAFWHRVHDVRATRAALELTCALKVAEIRAA